MKIGIDIHEKLVGFNVEGVISHEVVKRFSLTLQTP